MLCFSWHLGVMINDSIPNWFWNLTAVYIIKKNDWDSDFKIDTTRICNTFNNINHRTPPIFISSFSFWFINATRFFFPIDLKTIDELKKSDTPIWYFVLNHEL
jgi:hypothetical protein